MKDAPELAVLEYSEDEMVVGIGVTNFTDKSLLVSEDSLTAERQAFGEEEIQSATIYHFEDLAQEAAKEGYNTAYQVGDTAVKYWCWFYSFRGDRLCGWTVILLVG
jgi:hypothetical protein